MKEILKGSFVIFVFKIFGAISLFLTYILIPRYYGVEVFGVFNLIMASMMIGSVISRIGLDIYLLRVVSALENQEEKIALFLKSVIKILLISSILVALLILLLSPVLNQYIFKSIDASNYLIGLVLIMLPYTFFNVLPELFRGLNDIKRYSFFRNFSQNFTVVTLIGISIITAQMYDPIYILYLAIIVITTLLLFTIIKFLKDKNIDLRVKGEYPEKILKHSYPMFLTASIMFLMSYIDSFMISYYMDEYYVGIYSACINLSMILTFIPISIGGYISPKVSQAYSNNNQEEVKKIFRDSLKIIFVVTLPIFLVIYIFSEFFLGLFGEAFTTATTTLLITNIAFLSEALCGPVGFILNMTDNQHAFMRILIVSLLINILFNFLLIPSYGINGAGFALLLSMMFWTVGSFVLLKQKRII